MSVFRLKNVTAQDIVVEFHGKVITFPPSKVIDLVNEGSYVSGENTIEYYHGLSLDDIISVRGGKLSDAIISLLESGAIVCCPDGANFICVSDAIYLFMWGSHFHLTKQYIEGCGSAVAFESHNLMDATTWPEEQSKFTVTPIAGKTLYLAATKTLITNDIVTNDNLYFRIYAGQTLVKNIEYSSLDKLIIGAVDVNTIPQIGNPAQGGVKQGTLVHYRYERPIPLYNHLGMRLEIGWKDNTIPQSIGSILRIRVDCVSMPT